VAHPAVSGDLRAEGELGDVVGDASGGGDRVGGELSDVPRMEVAVVTLGPIVTVATAVGLFLCLVAAPEGARSLPGGPETALKQWRLLALPA
jgi:hypothetical protein